MTFERDVLELFPIGVVLVVTDRPLDDLFDEERLHVRNAVVSRQREFAAGRACARRALRLLGAPSGPLLPRSDRTVVWPPAVAGSISHTGSVAGAAVAWARDYVGLGLDLERAAELEPGVVARVCSASELAAARGAGVAWPAVALFGAKEAVFKCRYPIDGRWLEFSDVDVRFDPSGRFVADIAVGPRVLGRVLERGGIVASAAWQSAA